MEPFDYLNPKSKGERRQEAASGMAKSALFAVGRHIRDRFIPEVLTTFREKAKQGADEFVNVLYNGSAYLQWPGSSKSGPMQTKGPPEKIEPLVEPVAIQDAEAVQNDGYMTNRYEPDKADWDAGMGLSSYDPSLSVRPPAQREEGREI